MKQFLTQSAQALSTAPSYVTMQIKQVFVKILQKVFGWSRPDARGFMGVGTLYVAERSG